MILMLKPLHMTYMHKINIETSHNKGLFLGFINMNCKCKRKFQNKGLSEQPNMLGRKKHWLID
jgi:hypothetical protein